METADKYVILHCGISHFIKGILNLADKPDYQRFFAVVNSLLGKNVQPAATQMDDIFLAYQSSEKQSKKLLWGLQAIHIGEKDGGIELVAKEIEGKDIANLKSALQSLEEFVDDINFKRRASEIRTNLQNESGEIQNLSPPLIGSIMANDSMSALDKLVLMFRPGIKFNLAEKLYLNEKEKLKLLLAGHLDNLAFQYKTYPYMRNPDRCHEFFLGIASLVSPKERIAVDFDHRNEKAFEILADAYGFDEAEKNKILKITGAGEEYGTFQKLAVLRMPDFNTVPRHIIDEIMGSISKNGNIAVGKNFSDCLKIYAPANEGDISRIQRIIDVRGRANNEELIFIDDSALGLARKIEPKICHRAPYIWLPKLFAARNFVSEANKLAVINCVGIEGLIGCEEAANFLSEYFKTAPPFDEKIVMQSLKG